MDKNIVLIGMSGAGKTVIGKSLSYKMKMSFIDMDEYIENKYKMSITEIFNEYGEGYFRKSETEAAKFLSENLKNTIISTGGGVVLEPLNMEYLKSTGIIVYINRPVEKILSTVNLEKRPLLKSNPEKLYEMYKQRHLLYLKNADICVSNDSKFGDCVENIAEAVKNRYDNL